jgi:hypothetical protein
MRLTIMTLAATALFALAWGTPAGAVSLDVQSVPEPSTLVLVGLGTIIVAGRLRRRRSE